MAASATPSVGAARGASGAVGNVGNPSCREYLLLLRSAGGGPIMWKIESMTAAEYSVDVK
eukprot:4168406-Pyramimonas_sp.AAC.2